MAKRRKTRRQKINADSRQQNTSAKQPLPETVEEAQEAPRSTQYTFSGSISSKQSGDSQKNIIEKKDQSQYMYIKKDLVKTFIVTSTILALQLMLFFVIR